MRKYKVTKIITKVKSKVYEIEAEDEEDARKRFENPIRETIKHFPEQDQLLNFEYELVIEECE